MDKLTPHGVVVYENNTRRTDFLYRVSLKCIIRNSTGEVLVVKESGRSWWDLPGGGMDHGEDIAAAIAREMKEEVGLEGAFDFGVVAVEDPAHLKPHNFWQLRLIFEVTPQIMHFNVGDDGDEVAFIPPSAFKDSPVRTERRIFEYATL